MSAKIDAIPITIDAIPPPAGRFASRPHNEQAPELDTIRRWLLTNVAQSAGPEAMRRTLERWGFEARPRGGGHVSIRRRGTKDWYVVDPRGPDLGDLGDVLGDATKIGAAVGGGLVGGAIAAPATGPGALAAGAVGAGAGMGLVEAQLQALGRLGGVETTLPEAATAIGREALIGVVSEGVGAGIGAGLRAAGRGARRVVSRIPRGTGEIADELEEGVARAAKDLGLPPEATLRHMAAKAGEEEAYRLPASALKRKLIVDAMRREPFARAGSSAKRRTLLDFLERHGDEPVEITWITKGSKKKPPNLNRQGRATRPPRWASEAEVIEALDVPEEEARRIAAQLLGPKAYNMRLQDLPRAAFEAQPGVVKGTGTPGFVTERRNPHLKKIWDTLAEDEGTMFRGGYRHLDLDMVKKIRAGDDVIDFHRRPGALGTGLRKGAAAVQTVGRGVRRTKRVAAGGIQKLAGGAENVAKILERVGPMAIGRRVIGGRIGAAGGLLADIQATGGLGTAATLAAPAVARGIGRLSKTLMSDTSGSALRKLLALEFLPATVRRQIQYALQARSRGPTAYKAAVWVILQNPQLRALFAEDLTD